MKRFILESKNQEKSAYIWNTIAAMSNSFQTMVLLLVITRWGNAKDSSIFAIAYAVANLMLSIGKYGMRNYQVTDISNKYKFKTYLQSRIITGIFMIGLCVIYVGTGYLTGNYTWNKFWCMFLIGLVKFIEVMEDVYHGHLQQVGRLDIASKILGIRMLTYIFIFAVLYIITKNLLLTELICLIVMAIMAVGLNYMIVKAGYIHEEQDGYGGKKVLALLKECFPLAASTVMIMYIGNAPKYIIDSMVSDEVQTCFNIAFMPVFVITLLSNFIFNPIFNKLAIFWNEKDNENFKKIIERQMIIIVGLTISAIIFAYVIGYKILALIYGINLNDYKEILCILMFAGGILALLNLLNALLATIRHQTVLFLPFCVATVVLLSMGKQILRLSDLLGLTLFYSIILLNIFIVLIVALIYYVKKENKMNEEKRK